MSTKRNPGPSGGYRALLWLDRTLPACCFNALVTIGTAIAYLRMKEQRSCSRAYLSVILERPASLLDGFRHFQALTNSLITKLKAGRGDTIKINWADNTNHQRGNILEQPEPMLLGTFHVGASDLLGFGLNKFNRKVCMVRLRVENSEDIERLIKRTAGSVEIVWVDDERDIIFDLRNALEAGKSLAIPCDRVANTAKLEPFLFLGAQRLFPFTIYRMANLYQRAVLFCVALPADEPDAYVVHSSTPYTPQGKSKSEDHQAARQHFQEVLTWLEGLLKQHPLQWFNFIPLNPIATTTEEAQP